MSTNNNAAFPDCLKIPLIVGVSGHIDILTPECEIAKCMTEFWERLRELAGPDTPFILLSSIAAGADHFAVKYRSNEVKYCAVLPFEEKEYRKDFSGTALADYENDLKNADKVIQCNAAPGNYADASDYIRQHSDVLLTMWDGYESLVLNTSEPKKGGTYYQILAAFHLKMPHLEFREKVHLLVNLSVKRAKDNEARHKELGEKNVGGISEECSLSVLDWDKSSASFVATNFAEACRELSRIIRKEAEKKTRGYEETTNAIPFFPVILKRIREHNENLPTKPRSDYYLRKDIEDNISKGNRTTERCFKLIEDDFLRLEYFDDLAGKHQTPYRKQFFRIALFSVIIGILGQAWGDIVFSPDDLRHEWIMHGLILLYLVSFGLIFLYYGKTKRDANYFKYVRPRLIAEMLRLKIFWTLAGIRESFSDRFLKECAGYGFMVPICNWELGGMPMSEEDRSGLDSGKGFDVVTQFWLKDQIDYYQSYLLKDPKSFIIPEEGERCKGETFLSRSWWRAYFRKYERCEGYSLLFKRIFFWSAFILSFLLVLVFLIFRIKDPSSLEHTDFWGLACYREFIVGICPFIVATLGWMMEKYPWDRIAPQYRNALDLFRKTKLYLEEEHSISDKRQMIEELILYAHQENAEWNDIRIGAKPEPMI